jgi:hypothetical protein
MSLIFRLICAAHAQGSHHKLALDGQAAPTGATPQPADRG